ncbi:MAG: CocE/NonD family hydrolase [Granulosicoccus sp.]
MSEHAQIQHQFPRSVRVIEHQIIVMPDGCELSARIWLPEDASESPVPVILEHLPYRKRDGTIVRDCMNHPWFAGHGYACIRVDMRGNGDSQGIMHDEYLEQELQDACDVIQWATEQAWCSGTAGMMGISWGGFNALQVAALQPPALKAIITVCSTADRFADDIHYKGGCLLGENIGWAANMLSYSSRPPDPALVGEQWRKLWLERLENTPFLATTWLNKQERDDYWKHGSVCEDYSAIQAAVLSIGGWHDGYRNTISHLVENLDAPVKGIVGPWIHKYPHYAAPGPQIGFLQESLRWWDKWLKSVDNGAEALPDYRAYLMDSLAPAPWYDERPGRWIAEDTWPSERIVDKEFSATQDDNGQHLLQHNSIKRAAELDVLISSAANCGSQTGEYFPFTFGPELPDDQRVDDALSCCFDSDILSSAHNIVGAPKVSLRCTADQALVQLVVRLCDVMPDGRSSLISLGMINLTHALSHEFPKRLTAGDIIETSFHLDQIAYQVPKGHRLRLSISSSYWPFIWPSPVQASINLKQASLQIPLRPEVSDGDECEFEPAVMAPGWEHEVIRPAHSTRERYVDESTGLHKTRIFNDFGENKDSDHQLVNGSSVLEEFEIHPDDPLSASVNIRWEQHLSRDSWDIETTAIVKMHADEKWFYITGLLSASENGQTVFERDYDEKIQRRFV